MKTTISISDELFESADAMAAHMGISRSRLYATAVAEYVAKHRDTDITERLNEVYGAATEGLDPALQEAQAQSLKATEW